MAKNENKKEIKNNKDKTSFMKSFKAELKKVIWPTPKQLFNNTVAVLTIVLITAIIVFVLDFTFESINKYGIDKVKQVVSNSSNNGEVNSEDESIEENNSNDSTDGINTSNKVDGENATDTNIAENNSVEINTTTNE